MQAPSNESLVCLLGFSVLKKNLDINVKDKVINFDELELEESDSVAGTGEVTIEFKDTSLALDVSFEFNVGSENRHIKAPDFNNYYLQGVDIKEISIFKDDEEEPVEITKEVNLFTSYLIAIVLDTEIEYVITDFWFNKIEKSLNDQEANLDLDQLNPYIIKFSESKLSLKSIFDELISEGGFDVESGNLFLYHATDIKNLDKIKEQGILPSKPSNLPHSEGLVWLANSPDLARHHAEKKHPGSKVVVLKVKVNKKTDKLYKASFPGIYTIEGIVSPKKIVKEIE
jgi:hypothetical protein